MFMKKMKLIRMDRITGPRMTHQTEALALMSQHPVFSRKCLVIAHKATKMAGEPHPRSTKACRYFLSEKKEMARSV